ncbi:Ig-like domain-containing protein [Robertkochia flava]|uniref:Ig-like domain-containing protein n=1 Tax=Robertkochia flava TaxID=3447986 RepID=UPI001CD02C1B|nr:Ig-like domain-containing protein [Robertkochia marina]
MMKYRLICLLALVLAMTGCSSGDEDPGVENMSLFGVTIDGVNANTNPEQIPGNTVIQLNFSTGLDQQAFRNAVSITDGSGAVPMQVSFSNASATARITLSDLQPLKEHTFQLRSGKLGAKGEQLPQAVTFTFTTAAEAGYSACTTGTAECLRTMTIDVNGSNYEMQYYSNYDIDGDPEFVWSDLENLVVVVHGQNRDADNYFRIMNQTIAGTALHGKTLVVAPYFKDAAAANANALFWGSNWRFGADTGNTGAALSSFAVVDEMISRFSETARFPNMNTVFVTGHSSGASFSHYYGISSGITAQHPDLNFEFSVLNSQYFFYPTDYRFDEGTGQWYIPSGCAGFDYWPYGYKVAPAYLQTTDKNAVVQRLGSVNMVLFHGENDTSTTGTLNTNDCEAVLLGSDRLERGRNYNNYLNTYFPANNCDFTIVPNAAHDAGAMYGSEAFTQYLEARISN